MRLEGRALFWSFFYIALAGGDTWVAAVPLSHEKSWVNKVRQAAVSQPPVES